MLIGLFLLLSGTAGATTIPLNLGGSNDRVYDQLVTPFGSGITTLSGQTVSFDFTFSGDSFIHLYENTSSTFSIQPMLQLNGTGTILDVVGQAYTFNSLHQQNSPLWTFGGGSVTADVPSTLALATFSLSSTRKGCRALMVVRWISTARTSNSFFRTRRGSTSWARNSISVSMEPMGMTILPLGHMFPTVAAPSPCRRSC